MRILMLGWEFPPFIAGGLGTACAGLTRGLDQLGHEVIFVLPRPVGEGAGSHVELRSPASLSPVQGGAETPPEADARAGGSASGSGRDGPGGSGSGEAVGGASADSGGGGGRDAGEAGAGAAAGDVGEAGAGPPSRGLERTVFRALPAGFTNPYQSDPVGVSRALRRLGAHAEAGSLEARARLEVMGLSPGEVHASVASERPARDEAGGGGGEAVWAGVSRAGSGAGRDAAGTDEPAGAAGSVDAQYAGDLLEAADRYARLAVALAGRERFDVIHAHDWLTYRAGVAVRAATGKPLVVHIHATEFDRSGEHVNQAVYEIERWGLQAADRVIAVSMLTSSICQKRYGVDPERIHVVYNGVEREADQPREGARIAAQDRIVLFLGRITMQKGPEYFVWAAKRVLEKIDDVKFVVAGSGDMAMRMIEQAAAMGIGHKVLFTGFLRGPDVPRVFRMADCYVMPSVSEPFGIAPLEAISNDVPVIISKQSGVSEVLRHALKVDFWDVDEIANKIVAVLRHPPLSQTLRQHGAFELRRLTWRDSAANVAEVYRRALAGGVSGPGVAGEAGREPPAGARG